jgi:hypothetical protein
LRRGSNMTAWLTKLLTGNIGNLVRPAILAVFALLLLLLGIIGGCHVGLAVGYPVLGVLIGGAAAMLLAWKLSAGKPPDERDEDDPP